MTCAWVNKVDGMLYRHTRAHRYTHTHTHAYSLTSFSDHTHAHMQLTTETKSDAGMQQTLGTLMYTDKTVAIKFQLTFD